MSGNTFREITAACLLSMILSTDDYTKPATSCHKHQSTAPDFSDYSLLDALFVTCDRALEYQALTYRLQASMEDSMKIIESARCHTEDLPTLDNIFKTFYKTLLDTIENIEATGTSTLPSEFNHQISLFNIDPSVISLSDETKECAYSFFSDSLHHHPVRRTRKTISKEVKKILEEAFKAKAAPNTKERLLIAQRCALTPLQVRMWFTNKRTRNKIKQRIQPQFHP
ncbi:BA75_04356T0 [Komagataella pastoris]|uniref:BA75_04356T0 n=1 Tax=Komagataella pastoris TaxID=4922 RepID=A0A1B2JHI5_PICPA|nr:BA75_04356T0 [Komagataella pastoris]